MIENFIEYMWYLLTTPFKKQKKSLNKWYILCQVFGRRFDEAKEDILQAREEGMVATCSHEMLPVHGADRRLTRYEGESPENYRSRIAMYEEICKLGGTNEGIRMAVSSLGFAQVDIRPIKDFYGDPARWAEFLVLIRMDLSDTFPIGLKILRLTVRQWKEVGAKDNYLIDAGAENPVQVYCQATTQIGIEVFPQFNVSPHYLEGAHELSGNKSLSGYSEEETVDLYPAWNMAISQAKCGLDRAVSMRIQTDTPCIFEEETQVSMASPLPEEIRQEESVHIETHILTAASYSFGAQVEKHLRYLDGDGYLDGGRCLDADIYYCEF